MAYKRNMDNIKEAQNPKKESKGPRKKSTKTIASTMSPRHQYRLTGDPKGYM